MSESLGPKETKILADILALTLDEQPGQALAALQQLQQRARRDGVTGGALKNMFSRIASELPRAPQASQTGVNWFSTAEQRARIAAQEASISVLQQRFDMLQARFNQETELFEQQREEMAAAIRRATIKAALAGLLIGGALVALAGVLLPKVPPIFTNPQANSAAVRTPPRTVIARPTRPVDPSIVPAARDPSDTAPEPVYPQEAIARKQEGTVQMLVYIEADGHVAAVAVTHSTGVPELDVAAEQAVRQWKFRPAMKDGVPIASTMQENITFALRR
jgi:TonB family protein